MNTIEALVAVTLMIALVAGVMHAQAEARERIDEELAEKLGKEIEAGKQQQVVALGAGRSNQSVYRRWWVDE